MSSFKSLATALDGWFETALCDLPDELRQRIEKDFYLMPWDNLHPDQRRSVALQWDSQHNPTMEHEHEFWWNFFIRMGAIKQQIKEWETTTTHTATDLEKKETRLASLREELARMERRCQSQEDYHPERQRFDRKKLKSSPSSDSSTPYIACLKALTLLADRLEATPDELAAWVWMGPEYGGLAAYQNENELNPPPRFYYDPGSGDDFDYLSPLMACWFLADDIANFQPADRYITGKALIERWKEQPGIQPKAFIQAKIAESRLLDAHPLFGCTRGSSPDNESFPPLESGLFVLSHVEEIEAEDFGGNKFRKVATSVKTAERDKALQDAANTLAKQGRQDCRKTFSKREIAEKLAISDEWKEMTAVRIERIIRKEW